MLNKFMNEAIKIAQNNNDKDIPIGAIIVKNNQIIASASNNREKTKEVTGHAEILALNKASKFLNSWRLNECDMYVTLEPCPMCAWAIINSRIENLYFGSYDNKYGSFGSVINLAKLAESKINVIGGIEEDRCNKILKEYFKRIRNQKDEKQVK